MQISQVVARARQIVDLVDALKTEKTAFSDVRELVLAGVE